MKKLFFVMTGAIALLTACQKENTLADMRPIDQSASNKVTDYDGKKKDTIQFRSIPFGFVINGVRPYYSEILWRLSEPNIDSVDVVVTNVSTGSITRNMRKAVSSFGDSWIDESNTTYKVELFEANKHNPKLLFSQTYRTLS